MGVSCPDKDPFGESLWMTWEDLRPNLHPGPMETAQVREHQSPLLIPQSSMSLGYFPPSRLSRQVREEAQKLPQHLCQHMPGMLLHLGLPL